jgi:hypothetical protein
MSQFCILTVEKIYIFDNFSKQNLKIVNNLVQRRNDVIKNCDWNLPKKLRSFAFLGEELVFCDYDKEGSFWVLEKQSFQLIVSF